MASLDSLRHVSIGQYIPTGSPIHRLDPRAKLLAVGLLIIATVIATRYVSNVLLLGSVLALVLIARLPLGYILSAVKPALPIIVILALLQLLFYRGPMEETHPLVDWHMVRITTAGLRMVIISLLRFLDLLFLTSLLTNTTTTGELTRGLERLLQPLESMHLPAHELALVGSIALRFVPILGEQMESILMAQEARGVAEVRGRWQVLHNAKRVAALVVPLFVDAYRRAEEMALAMQARCYRGGRGRTHLIELVFGWRDYVALATVILLTAAIFGVQRLPLP